MIEPLVANPRENGIGGLRGENDGEREQRGDETTHSDRRIRGNGEEETKVRAPESPSQVDG